MFVLYSLHPTEISCINHVCNFHEIHNWRIGFQSAGLNLHGLFFLQLFSWPNSIHVLRIALVLSNMMSMLFLALCTSHPEFTHVILMLFVFVVIPLEYMFLTVSNWIYSLDLFHLEAAPGQRFPMFCINVPMARMKLQTFSSLILAVLRLIFHPSNVNKGLDITIVAPLILQIYPCHAAASPLAILLP